jgi:nucleotide-binding universal stress UspA family protein
MLSRVLVGLDGSERAQHAVSWVRAVFPRAELILLTAIKPGCHCSAPDCVYTNQMALLQIQAARRYLTATAEALAPGSRIVVQEGSPAHSILNAATRLDADLIVVTTHSATGARTPLLGGTAEQLLFGAHRPLLFLPVRNGRPIPPLRIRRILAPLDGSDISEMILPLAESVAAESGAEILIGHILTGPEDRPHLSCRLPGAKIVMRRGAVPEDLLALAREKNVDLISMCAHGHGGLNRRMFGSVTTRVVRESTVPVLVARHDALKRLSRPPREQAHAG